VLLGILVLHERPTKTAVTGILLGIAGVAVMSWQPGGHSTLTGDGLVLTDSFASAWYVILASRLVREIHPLPLTAAQFVIGLLIIASITTIGWTVGIEPAPAFPASGPLLALLITGVIGIAASFLTYTWALEKVTVSAAAAAVPLTPLAALLFSASVLGEPITITAAVAAALIVAGLGVFAFGNRPRRPATPDADRYNKREMPRGLDVWTEAALRQAE